MSKGKDDSRTVKRAGRSASDQRRGTMHGSTSERSLMSGTGALIKWNASKVPVSGDRPGQGKNRP